jgi:Legume lectin domain
MKRGWGRAGCISILFVVVGTGRIQSEILFENFKSLGGLALVGNAKVVGQMLRLTPARRNQTGAAWVRTKQAIGSGFETTFQFRLTHQDWLFHGTDGFAFVVQNSGPDAIGGRGSAAGFGMPDPTNPRHVGIPHMIAVFFDTLRNPDENDPSSNYVAVRANAGSASMRWPATRLSFRPKLSVTLKDGKVHTARILFQPPILSVFLDDSEVLKTVVDFSFATDHNGDAWVGFTAATGWGYQNHDILSWSFARPSVSSSLALVSSDISFPMSSCMPNRNLCTPERPFVEPRTSGYHIVLPANLQWGASIPNPSGKPVIVTNAKGIVCWDAKLTSEGCSGPTGNDGVAKRGFLDEEKAPGALIMKTENGQTLFSINGRPDLGFTSSEGFYEFDVRIE